jgi:hypothetical protein
MPQISFFLSLISFLFYRLIFQSIKKKLKKNRKTAEKKKREVCFFTDKNGMIKYRGSADEVTVKKVSHFSLLKMIDSFSYFFFDQRTIF